MIVLRLHPVEIEKPREETLLFLSRPVVPDQLEATEIDRQFRSESIRIDGLTQRRKRCLRERLLAPSPLAV